jgi:hypothetical protein
MNGRKNRWKVIGISVAKKERAKVRKFRRIFRG